MVEVLGEKMTKEKEKKVDVFIVDDIPLIEDESFSIKVETSNQNRTAVNSLITEKFIVPINKKIKIKEIRIEYEIKND